MVEGSPTQEPYSSTPLPSFLLTRLPVGLWFDSVTNVAESGVYFYSRIRKVLVPKLVPILGLASPEVF